MAGKGTKNRPGKVLSLIWDYLLISFGTLIYTLAWDAFMIPQGIASGGVTGMSTVLEYATGIPVSYSFLGINAILLLAGFLVLGRGFGIKTIYVIVLSSVLFEVLPNVEIIKSLPGHPLYISEKVLVPIVGGLMEAIGIGIIFKRGGSTGGTDIIALIIDKYYPITPGTVYLVLDVFTIASIMLVPGKGFQEMLYGYIAMVIFSVVLDWFVMGSKTTLLVLVFSRNYDKIADYIISEMDRGVTILHAKGWYTKKEKEVLMVLVRKSQLPELTEVIKGNDPEALMSVTPASSVYGEGFERIKTGIHRKRRVQGPSLNQ